MVAAKKAVVVSRPTTTTLPLAFHGSVRSFRVTRMFQLLKPPGTATCYNLSYAGTWSYKITAPYAHLPLCLARISDSTRWVLCHYQRPSQVWQVLHVFDPKEIDEYLSDNEEDLRILGWENNDAKNGVSLYFDLQFQERDDLLDWCRHVLDMRVKRGNMLLSSLDMIDMFQRHPAPRSILSQATPGYLSLGARDPLAQFRGFPFAILSMSRDPRIAAKYAATTAPHSETTVSSASLRRAVGNGLKTRPRVPLLHQQSEQQNPVESIGETLMGPPLTARKQRQQQQDIVGDEVSSAVLTETCAPATAMSEVLRSRKHWAEEWDSGVRPPKRRKKSKKEQLLEHTMTSESEQATQSLTKISDQLVVSAQTVAERRLSSSVLTESMKIDGNQQAKEDAFVREEATSNKLSSQVTLAIIEAPLVDATPESEVHPVLPFEPSHSSTAAPSQNNPRVIDLGDDSDPSSQESTFVDRIVNDGSHEDVGNREASSEPVLTPGLGKKTHASRESEGRCDSNQHNQTTADIEQHEAIPSNTPGPELERLKEQPALISGNERVRSEISRLQPLSPSNSGISEAEKVPSRSSERPECPVTPIKQGEGSSQPLLSPSATGFDERLTSMLAGAEPDPGTSSSSFLAQFIHLLKVQQSMIAETRSEVAALRDEVKDLKSRAK